MAQKASATFLPLPKMDSIDKKHKKHCSIKKKVFYCQRGFVFGCFFFARNRADRLLGR